LAGLAVIGFSVNAFAVWLPTFLVRVRGMSVEAAGSVTGIGAIIAGLLGTFLGGIVADRWMKKRQDARMRILVVRSVFVIPFLVAMFFVSSPLMLIALIVIGSSVSAIWFGPASAVVHDLVRPELRSFAVAVYILCINVAAGISPLLVGKLTDMSGDPLFLQYMLLIAPVADIFAALCHYIGSRYIVADMQSNLHAMEAA
jgi:MFS family permease